MVKNNNSIGIMQGRLTKPIGRGIQFFPFENWQQEFKDAQKLDLREIEFIFDLYKYRQNPLWSKAGRNKIVKLIKKTGVVVNSICADYFMRRPFFRVSSKMMDENIKLLKRLIKYTSEIGATLIEIPLVDNSSIKNKKEEDNMIDVVRKVTPFLEKYKVRLDFETDMAPKSFLSFINKINNPIVGANYDTGNSASLGYDPRVEMELYGQKIFNIHIKDRVYKGGTVTLGQGDTKFKRFIKSLIRLVYRGSFILQAARGEEGKEMDTIKNQMNFLKKLWI
jgi:hexulose-6-phosphate isomerase